MTVKAFVALLLVTLAIGDAFGAEIFRPPRPTRPTRPTRTPRPTTTTTTTTVRPPPDVVQTEGCGGVLEGASGLVSYKYFKSESVNPNEVCVWTIRAPGSGEIEVTLDGDGFSGENTYISLITVGDRARLQKSHKILASDRTIYKTEGQVAYVLFRSGPSASGQGFQLYFRGVANTEDSSYWTGGNKTHVHFHLNRAQGQAEEFAYPDPRARYQPDEFGSWVLNPELPKTRNSLILYYLDFEDFSCADFINIHGIEGDSPVFLESKCNTNTFFSSSFRYNTAKEPIIVTFHTNYHSERSGFIMYYENDRY